MEICCIDACMTGDRLHGSVARGGSRRRRSLFMRCLAKHPMPRNGKSYDIPSSLDHAASYGTVNTASGEAQPPLQDRSRPR